MKQQEVNVQLRRWWLSELKAITARVAKEEERRQARERAKAEKRLGDYKRVRTSEAAIIREGTKKSSKVVVTVPTGTDLWLSAATDNRAKVTTSSDANGKRYTGYIELKSIS